MSLVTGGDRRLFLRGNAILSTCPRQQSYKKHQQG
jgi:hypothetical protein